MTSDEAVVGWRSSPAPALFELEGATPTRIDRRGRVQLGDGVDSAPSGIRRENRGDTQVSVRKRSPQSRHLLDAGADNTLSAAVSADDAASGATAAAVTGRSRQAGTAAPWRARRALAL
jgi:hypothetical protein